MQMKTSITRPFPPVQMQASIDWCWFRFLFDLLFYQFITLKVVGKKAKIGCDSHTFGVQNDIVDEEGKKAVCGHVVVCNLKCEEKKENGLETRKEFSSSIDDEA